MKNKNKNQEINLPAGFWWGASGSAHQTEGGNKNDWTVWERKNAKRLAKEASSKWENWQQGRFPQMFQEENYISGSASNHYNLFEKDFSLAKSLGHNAHRLSFEWSRIEPRKGFFDDRALRHYSKVIGSLRKNGLEPFVTLWHWTLPLWLKKEGGLTSDRFPEYFSRFAEKIAWRFRKKVNHWITLNEPTVLISNAYLRGLWPPQKKSLSEAGKAFSNLASAHCLAYDRMKAINPNFKIGFANMMVFIEPKYKICVFDRMAAKIYRYWSNEKFYRLTSLKHDFLGLNYYFHSKIRFTFKNCNENKEVSDLGWEIYPTGIYRIVKEAVKYVGRKDLPIYITENGLADEEDRKRLEFILSHLKELERLIKEGFPVAGYFHWSLTDNFEWDKGFWPRFGLIEVDYKTQKRKVRESALNLKEIISLKE